jgi:tetratricopeptide (TPR) repeat protein
LNVLRGRRSWIPLDTLLAMERPPDARNARELSLFYAQSWALTHYLMMGGSSIDLDLMASGYAEPLASGDLPQLEHGLDAYVRSGRFRALRLSLLPAVAESNDEEDPGITVRTVSPAESLVVRARFLLDGERPAAALPLLTEALRLDPNRTSVLEALGYFHFQQNNPIEAAGWFDRAIASRSAGYLAYYYRAILAGSVPTSAPGGAPVPAEDHLRRVIELNPGFAPAYARLANFHAREAGRPEEALRLLRQATALEPGDASHWLNLGRLLLELDRPGEARNAGEQGLAAARSTRSRELLHAFLRELKPGRLTPSTCASELREPAGVSP